jgi:23S rRNA (adenine-N6)-dimethyltransferase
VAAHPRGRRADGQHFLRSQRLADELVAAACLDRGDLVLEIGAGSGRLTGPLRRAAGRVIAVELDPSLAAGLERRFARYASVAVVRGDILAVPLPHEPFRAFGNVPFGLTTALLRRLLDDPYGPLSRADVIVQDGLAQKRSSLRPCSMLSLSWLPWWEIGIGRHLPAGCFEPRPAVDAAMLVARRRPRPLLYPAAAAPYRELLRRAFARAQRPVRHGLGLPPRRWKALARERGLPLDARPQQLDVWDWVAAFEARQSIRPSWRRIETESE